MTFKKYKMFVLLTLVTFLVFLPYAEALALRIIPQRLVLQPDVKVQHIFVKNNSQKTEAYRFGWKQMAMDKEGKVINIEKVGIENAPEGYKPVDDLIRFSPRRAVLKPGQTQRITLIINRSKALEAGEYRSHFLFQREPYTEKQSLDDAANNTTEKLTAPVVSYDVLVSRAIPIYLVHGETSAKLDYVSASISKNPHKKVEKQPDHLIDFKVKKTGNRSVIGIAEVSCLSGGKKVVISKPAKVFAVYAEGEYRNEQIGVNMPAKGCSSYNLLVKGHPDDILAGQTLINQSF